MEPFLDPAIAALHQARRRIAEQRARARQQAEVAATLEKSGDVRLAEQGREILVRMTELLARMENEVAAEERRLVELADPLDEESLDHVARDCPL